jgi:hypothetical protein
VKEAIGRLALREERAGPRMARSASERKSQQSEAG